MNLTYLRIEIKRLIRNPRIMIFTIILPSVMLGVFGSQAKGATIGGVPASAYLMVTIGLYGAMTAALSSAGLIAVERSIGWNRQLRLTPLTPAKYVLAKFGLSMLIALVPLIVVQLIGAIGLGVRLPAGTWAGAFLGAWLGAVPFAALGIALGYVAKPSSIQQLSGLISMMLALFGGLWVPYEAMPHWMKIVADVTPTHWVSQVALSPLSGGVTRHAITVMAAWTLGLALLARRLFRADTARA
jgi:ABC-2 type transport system permease protein